MKKKILSVLIAATLTLSLTACGGNGEQKGGDSGEGGLSGGDHCLELGRSVGSSGSSG